MRVELCRVILLLLPQVLLIFLLVLAGRLIQFLLHLIEVIGNENATTLAASFRFRDEQNRWK